MLEKLKELGVDIEKVLSMLNGKQALYERLILKFYDMAKKMDLREDNLDDIYERVHALKGAAGNLGITPLFNIYVEILALIKEDKMAEVSEKIKKLLPIQEEILACIEVYK